MVHATCSVRGCKSSSHLHKHLRFHQFPHNRDRCQLWINACKRQDLEEDLTKNKQKLKHVYVCNLHFKQNMYTKKNYLNKSAVPKLHLPNDYTPEPRIKKQKLIKLVSYLFVFLNPKKQSLKMAEDEFDMFGKSLAIQLKNMPLDRALVCQERLLAVMGEERMAQLNTDSASASTGDETAFPIYEYIKIEDEELT